MKHNNTSPASPARSFRRTRRTCLAVAALLLGSLHGTAFGASLWAQSNTRSFDVDYNLLDPICSDYSFSGAQTQCSGTYALPGSTLTYDSSSSADYGVLKVAGSVSIARPDAPSGTTGPDHVDSDASAYFRDTWTITGMPNGTTGTLQLTFDITGTYGSSGVNTGQTFGLSLFNANTNTYDTDSQLPSYTGVLTTQFVYGTPLDFRVSLIGGATLWDLYGGGTDGQFSFLDMSHTAVLNAIIVKDEGGNSVPFALSTESGATTFSELAPAAVPVPAALPLLLSGMIGLVSFARRKRA